MQKQSIAVILLGFVLLILSAWPAFGPQYTIMKDTTFSVPTGTTAVNLAGNPATALTLMKGDDESLSADLSRLPAGRYTLALTPSAQEMDVQILPYSTGYTAALGALLLLLGLPGALIPTSPLRIKGGGKVGGWLYLVVDSQGMSLPRVLLIIFFVPCAIVYMTLAFALHEFPNLPDSIWQLLGFGGVGAALGAMLEPGKKPGNGDAPPQDPGGQPAAAPPEVKQAMDEVAASAQPAPVPTQPSPPAVPDVVTIKRPEFSDLFRDPNGFGDISHFQTLVISLATAIVFLFSFFDDWVVPDIPTPVLQLLGTSLGVYLGVKGVKLFKQS